MSGQLTLQGTSHTAFSDAKRKKVLRALAISTGVESSAVHIVSVSACSGGASGAESNSSQSVKICFEIDAANTDAELALEAALKGPDFPAKFSASLKKGAEAKKKKKGKKKGRK